MLFWSRDSNKRKTHKELGFWQCSVLGSEGQLLKYAHLEFTEMKAYLHVSVYILYTSIKGLKTESSTMHSEG